jgi:hypothetical protein
LNGINKESIGTGMLKIFVETLRPRTSVEKTNCRGFLKLIIAHCGSGTEGGM